MTHELPRYIVTEGERTRILGRLVEIAEAHADGRIPTDQARHELKTLIAPVKRRARRAARLGTVDGGAMGT